MPNELDIRHIDRRTLERYLERGILNEKDYEKYLKSLPDLSDAADNVTSKQPEASNTPTR